MSNLLRSQFYSLRHEAGLFIVVFLGMTVICWFFSALNSGELLLAADEDFLPPELSASAKFGLSGSENTLFGELFILIAAGLFMSRDMDDKTVNYEIMGGHTRRDVFFSRALLTMGIGISGGLLMLIATPVIDTVRFGWGNEIAAGTVVFRLFLLLVLFARLSAELVLIAAIVRRTYLVYIIGILLGLLEVSTGYFFDGAFYVFAETQAEGLLNFKIFMLEHLDGTMSYYFDSVLDTHTVLVTLLCNLAVTGLSLFYGCRYFEAADLE